jgi:O-antigen/teichoic acid export membrane protein
MKFATRPLTILGNMKSDVLWAGRNALWNLAALTVPVALGVTLLPFTIHGLGVPRFGILTLCWALLGYGTFLDLGFSRALTKYLSAGAQGDEAASLISTGLAIQGAISLLFSVLFVLFAHTVAGWLNLAQGKMAEEAVASLRVVGFAFPPILVTNLLGATLEARGKFRELALWRGVQGAAVYTIPAVGALAKSELQTILIVVLLVRIGVAVALFCRVRAVYGGLSLSMVSWHRMKRLGRFGGWITVSALCGPLLMYYERLLIPRFRSIEDMTYYSAPLDILSRLAILPMSLVTVLFPVVAASEHGDDAHRAKVKHQAWLALGVLALALGVILTPLATFSGPLLRAWLGGEFAQRSSKVLRILAIGAFFNCVAYVPMTVFQASGHPEFPAKLHVGELLLYLFAAPLLIFYFGIVGAALAWTGRAAVDSVLLLLALANPGHWSLWEAAGDGSGGVAGQTLSQWPTPSRPRGET